MKVLLALFRLEVHSIGLWSVARALEDAGHEVLVLGNAAPAEIASAALQEDVDAVGVSCHCGGEIEHGALLMAHMLLRAGRMPVMMIGGLIPAEHKEQLEAMGYAVFTPDEPAEAVLVALTETAPA